VCKKSIKNSQPLVKKMKNARTPQGGFFFDSHCTYFKLYYKDLPAKLAAPDVHAANAQIRLRSCN